MNTAQTLNRISMLLFAAVLLAAGVLWWVGEVRAAARLAPPPPAPSVQDKPQGIDLDTKIFLHRNALLVSAASARPIL